MFGGEQANRLSGMARERALEAKTGTGMQRMGKWRWDTQCAGVGREIKKTASTSSSGR